ncbi:hypothetical protein ACFE04_029678 [Oxalis oulophora]
MASQLIETHMKGAEVYHGEATCRQKIREIFVEHGLPNNLIPIDFKEFGFNRSTGFVWLKHTEKREHKNKKINKKAAYDAEITAFMEKGRLKKITGIKSQQLLIWVTISDMYVDEKGNVMFATPTGMGRAFPFSAFELEEEVDKKNTK